MGHFVYVYELCKILTIVFMILEISSHANLYKIVAWWRRVNNDNDNDLISLPREERLNNKSLS
jgi:hypothetical protein